MNQNKFQRAKSYFYNMRKFHNNIKRDLLNKYANNVNNLLDLACGKGGDLQKWYDNKIKNIIGYDINEVSVKEANRRLQTFNPNFHVELNTLDLSKNVLKGSNNIDVVTSMFAFHYFFENESTFETIFDSINNNLKIGGIFMGTFFDGKSVRELLKSNIQFEERFYITSRNVDNQKEMFGNKIGVSLKDTVLDEITDEYIVNFNWFVNVMKLRGYNLIESHLFSELNYNSFNLNNIEKQCSFLNRTFVFEKVFDLNHITFEKRL
jgi:mRNA (guanine-N7-)-methyltransferase